VNDTAWLVINVAINSLVIGGGALILLSPLSRKFLRNGRTPLLNLTRTIVAAIIVQALLRIWIESVEDGDLRELIRIGIGLTSFAVIVAVGRFLWGVIDGALRSKDEAH